MINTAPPSGMRDFLPAELARRRYVQQIIRSTFEQFGFVELETPAVENLSTLLGKYGEEGDQLLFRLLHRRDKLTRALETSGVSEKDLAETGLRYDLTVPLARVMAHHPDLPRFFKRYQMQSVWRADRPGKGRFREFMQCDVDITGTKSLLAEVEVCSAVVEALNQLKFTDFAVHLNHRQLLRCLIKAAGIDPAMEETTLVAVDKWDKIGEDGVLKDLEARGIPRSIGETLLALLRRPEKVSEEEELGRLEKALSEIPDAKIPIEELRELLAMATKTPAGPKLFIDATLARGLGYYTGPIFEIRSAQAKGSLGGGGRYDGLIGMFSNREIPAVGFSIGFERVVLVMEENSLFPALGTGAQLLLCRFEDVSPAIALDYATQLRASGIRVEVFPDAGKIGKQIGYADTVGIPVVGILGGNEVKDGVIGLKHLKSGEQAKLSPVLAAAQVNTWLKS